jgi:hypothetical protein
MKWDYWITLYLQTHCTAHLVTQHLQRHGNAGRVAGGAAGIMCNARCSH